MSKPKSYVVVTETDDWIMCVGVYQNYLEAYGKALISVHHYLTDFETDKKPSITPLQPLETDSGFAIRGQLDGKTDISAYVLFNDDDNEGQEGV